MNCLSLSLRFRLAISELPYFGMYVYYRPSFEAVVGRKEIKTPYNVIILSNYLSLTLPVQGAMDTDYSILDFAGQARQTKEI